MMRIRQLNTNVQEHHKLTPVGVSEGDEVGLVVGSAVGCSLGVSLGIELGDIDGVEDG